MNRPKTVAINILSVPSKTINSFTQKTINFFRLWGRIDNLAAENAQLKQSNQELTAQLANLKTVQGENDQLRQDLNFQQKRTDLKLIPAQVLSYSPIKSYGVMTINKGADDGIVNEQVVVNNGYLVGKIKYVRNNSADVWLINNRNLTVPVMVPGTNATGLLRGGISGLEVTDLPFDIKIEKGTTVVTSALESYYPSGIAVGEVTTVSSDKDEVFIVLKVSSPVNFSQLNNIFVVQQ